jgi:hypothetical protein
MNGRKRAQKGLNEVVYIQTTSRYTAQDKGLGGKNRLIIFYLFSEPFPKIHHVKNL